MVLNDNRGAQEQLTERCGCCKKMLVMLIQKKVGMKELDVPDPGAGVSCSVNSLALPVYLERGRICSLIICRKLFFNFCLSSTVLKVAISVSLNMKSGS